MADACMTGRSRAMLVAVILSAVELKRLSAGRCGHLPKATQRRMRSEVSRKPTLEIACTPCSLSLPVTPTRKGRQEGGSGQINGQ
jgi:hypothetical protein